ncbi:MAG: DUF547 domain-containing protein [Pseudomonadales bacterium]
MLGKIMCVFLLCAPALSATAMAGEQYDEAMAAWSRTLERFVDDEGRTDFKSLASQTEDLRKVIDFIESTSPASHPEQFASKEEVLAYHINAYNALAMYGVIDEGIPAGFNSFFKRAGFFKFRKVIIGNKKTSLYDYENKVIRPLDEPRVHFALNCMVRDCPRLPRQIFSAETLDQQLEAAAKEFFAKDLHFRQDDNKRIAYVSSILDFYTKDFVPSGKAADLGSYINTYREQPVPEGYKIKFIKYDWTINQQPK